MSRRSAGVLALAILLGLAALATRQRPELPAPATPVAVPTPDGRAHAAPAFDHYVLALSWSPSFCRANPGEREQCTRDFGFVLHGLWPQSATGRGPERCETHARPDQRTIERALAFMPSRRLIHHEWRTHGSCSGLDPASYFAVSGQAFAGFQPPPALQAPRRSLTMDARTLRSALKQANPGLEDDMLSLHCRRGEFTELRICVNSDDLAPRTCTAHVRDRCPARTAFLIPAVD